METKLETGVFIRMSYASGNEQRPVILVAPGWGSDILHSTTFAELSYKLNQIGYHVCLLAPRGYLGAEGDINKVTIDDHLFDVRCAYHWLVKDSRVDSSRICGLGVSHGGHLLATLAGERTLDSAQLLTLLALRAPAIYPGLDMCPEWAKPSTPVAQLLTPGDNLKHWWSAVHTKDESTALAGISNFTGKLLFILSGDDQVIPPQVALSYGEAATQATSLECKIIPGAPHALQGEHRSAFMDLCVAWFRENYPIPT